ncbi:Hypothetical protein NTJ_10703 [Nesidiocoris tenuis]|uniref:Clip domain-containing protein n=1 Tax=Nesidiocoris tenuis TaxID=355587 RepID=A0ABN7B0E3_9HEMI|nr:Hypothetical protein NTJ_10703 [Nesidiocoris tenuis]
MGEDHKGVNGNGTQPNGNGDDYNGNGANSNGNGAHSNGNGAGSNGNGAGSNGSDKCELEKKDCKPKQSKLFGSSQDCKPKRDILKLLKECDRSAKPAVEEKCCSWHKYVFYALPLALYLPWLIKMGRCPPRCCPPRYCCPREKPVCPPPKLSCGPKASRPRPCPRKPEPAPRECPHDART